MMKDMDDKYEEVRRPSVIAKEEAAAAAASAELVGEDSAPPPRPIILRVNTFPKT